jgi:hypothetical protein
MAKISIPLRPWWVYALWALGGLTVLGGLGYLGYSYFKKKKEAAGLEKTSEGGIADDEKPSKRGNSEVADDVNTTSNSPQKRNQITAENAVTAMEKNGEYQYRIGFLKKTNISIKTLAAMPPGPTQAALQVGLYNNGYPVTIDGKIGRKTMTAIAKLMRVKDASKINLIDIANKFSDINIAQIKIRPDIGKV